MYMELETFQTNRESNKKFYNVSYVFLKHSTTRFKNQKFHYNGFGFVENVILIPIIINISWWSLIRVYLEL